MALKFRRGTTAQKSGSLAFGEPYVNTTLGTLQVGLETGDVTLLINSASQGISGSSLDITGNAKIDGNLTLGGNITIGDQTTDTVAVNANLSSSLIPSATNTFDLGSSTKIWRDLYISTGSIKFVAGTSVVKELTLATITGLENATGSNDTKFNTLATYTGSVETRLTQIGVVSGSLISSASANTISITNINTFSGSQLTQNTALATITGSLITTASNSIQRLGAIESVSGSWITESETSSFARTNTSNTFAGNQAVTGNLVVTGSITANEFYVTYVTSSVMYNSGSNRFGDSADDLQQLIGVVEITGSIKGTQFNNLATITGSLITTASNHEQRIAANESVSSSYARTNLSNTFSNNQIISGNINLTGRLTAGLAVSASALNINKADGNVQIELSNSTTGRGFHLISYNGDSFSIHNSLTGLSTFRIDSGSTGYHTHLFGDLFVSSGSIEVSDGITGSIAATNGIVSGSSQITLQSTTGFTSYNSALATITGSLISSASADRVSITNINSATASLIIETTNLETFSASVLTRLTEVGVVTGSLISSASAAAIANSNQNTFTASANTSISNLQTTTASLNTSVTNLNSFSSSALTRLSALETETANLETTTASLNTSVSNLNSFSSSQLGKDATLATLTASYDGRFSTISTVTSSYDGRFSTLGTYTGSVEGRFTTLAALTGSNSTRLSNLETTTASLNTSVSNLNSFSSSQLGKDATLATLTSSYDGRFTTIGSVTASYDGRFTSLATYTGSNDTKWSTLGSLSGSFARTNSANIFSGNQTITGSLFVSQDLVVAGSSSIQNISSSTLNIGTNLITVAVNQPSVRFGGLAVIDSGSSGASGSLLYDSVQDEFIFVHKGNGTNVTSSHFILGPETIDNLGNETYLTNNRVPKGSGKEHLNDSQISDDGTTVTIPGALTVTGNITGPITATNGVVSGSSQVISILTSLNSYTASNDTTNTSQNTSITNLNSTTASLNTSVTNLNSYTSSFPTATVTLSNKTLITPTIAAVGGDEGGQIDFALAATNQTLTGSISFDIWRDRFRIFEGGGTNKGVFLQISSASATVGSEIIIDNGTQTLTNKTISGTSNTLSNIGNSSLTNSSITIAGTSTSLGGSITAATILQGTGVISGSSQLTTDFDSRYLNTNGDSVVSGSSQISHDSTTGYSANRHVDHTAVTITAGSGLTGGGDISTTRTLSIATGGVTDSMLAGSISNGKLANSAITIAGTSTSLGGTITLATITGNSGIVSGSSQITAGSTTGFATAVKTQLDTNTVVSGSSQITLSSTTGYSANQHVDHTAVSISAGNGLSGGGTIAATRTLSLDTTSATFTSGVTTQNNALGVVSGSKTISGITLGSNLATLTIGTGLSGTSYNGSTAVTIANSGVLSNIAGSGISVSGGTGNVTITNTGVTSAVAGTGVSVSGATGAVTISIGQSVATSATPTFAGLTINGAITATGDITAYYTSDKRHKNNIQIIPNALEKVSKLNGVTWEWNDDVNEVTKSTPKTGLIAQDVQSVLPEVVKEREDGFLSLDYSKMMGLMVEAIKEQQTQIHKLNLEIEVLKKQKGL
jgi:hypothetical protein